MKQSGAPIPRRSTTLIGVVFVILGIFVIRLFYLQIIRYDFYRAEALAEHLKKFELEPARGQIKAHDGDHLIPMVLNENRPTLFADPRYVKDADKSALKIAQIIGGDANKYKEELTSDRNYIVLQKKLTKEQADTIKAAQRNGELKGVGLTDVSYRVYPQGQVAAQILGFVNGEGVGQYGIESGMETELKGKPGLLKAITDINGIPLAASNDTIEKPVENGKDINLTIDINAQKQLEDLLKEQSEKYKAKSAGAVVLSAQSGAVVAMANYPSFDPAAYDKVTDYSVFNNKVISTAYEPGSIIKVFTMATGLNEGAIAPNTTFYDSQTTQVEDRIIKNSYPWGAAQRSMTEILQKSLNTGAVFVLRSLGGGTINTQGREKLYQYFTEHFRLGKPTGIELGGEVGGTIIQPNNGDGDNVRYANMSFGQGMTVNLVQVAAGFASILNGGSYYKPHVVETSSDPKAIQVNAVSNTTSQSIREMLSAAGQNAQLGRTGYMMGGKSGTAQIADERGGYQEDKTNDSYMGYVGGSRPEYVIVVRISEPNSAIGGTYTAGQIVKNMANWLVDYYAIPPGK